MWCQSCCCACCFDDCPLDKVINGCCTTCIIFFEDVTPRLYTALCCRPPDPCARRLQVPQIVIMVMLGKLNFVETASAISITGFIFNVLLSLRGVLVNCIVAGNLIGEM